MRSASSTFMPLRHRSNSFRSNHFLVRLAKLTLRVSIGRSLAAKAVRKQGLWTRLGRLKFGTNAAPTRSLCSSSNGEASGQNLEDVSFVAANGISIHAFQEGLRKERQRHSREEDRDRSLAAESLINSLQKAGPLQFSRVVADLLQTHMLRETNVKDICVDLAKSGRIENTWGGGNRKPRDSDIIRLRGVPS
jgi:hypothetical protein